MDDPFDTGTAVPPSQVDVRTPVFYDAAAHWPNKGTVGALIDAEHALDMARAQQPPALEPAPVVHVTLEGVEGHFTKTLGEDGISYSPGPAPELEEAE